MKISAFILVLLLPLIQATGQATYDSIRVMTGRVINVSDSIPVPFAHIHNESLRTSAISDSSGFFNMHVSINDSLVFSAVNFFPKLMVINHKHIADSTTNVFLKERIYEIEEVAVYGIGSYRQFKQKVLHLELPETQTEELQREILDSSQSVAKKAVKEMEIEELYNRSPLEKVRIATVPIYSKDEKERLKLKKIIEKEKIQKQVDKKFNKEIIAGLTDLKEPELTKFFVFLNFSNKFVLNSSDYALRKAILDKFELFLEQNNEHERLDSVLRRREGSASKN